MQEANPMRPSFRIAEVDKPEVHDALDAVTEAVTKSVSELQPARRSLDQRAADMRDAAIWNTLILAKAHGLSPEITEADVARWRTVRTITDELAIGANDAESVPAGFGPLVRSRQTETLLKIATKAIPSAAETQTPG